MQIEREMILKIIAALFNLATVISLVCIPEISVGWKCFVFVFGMLCVAYLLYDAIKSSQKNEIICHSSEEIANTMKALIKTQGKICIMSRDLSWVDDEMSACISAKKDSVLIFAQKESKITKELISNGVIVKYYGHLSFEPKTRFTIIRFNRNNPQVAIADTQDSVRKKSKFKHVIYETADGKSMQDKWINSLALDMIALCDAVASVGENNDETNKSQES